MRIGVVTRYLGYNDGQGRVNFEIARQAGLSGHDVLVFSEAVDPRVLALRGVRAVLSPPPSWLPSRLLRDQVFAWRSLRALRRPENRCDCVLANGFVTWARSDLNGAHFVHAAWRRSQPPPARTARARYDQIYGRLNEALERRAFRHSNRVVAVSDLVADEVARLGIAYTRIDVIANGVDTAEFVPGPIRRSAFGLPETVPIALFAGDLTTPRKNLESVLLALKHAPDLHLAVAGKTVNTVYPDLARELGVRDRTHFLGFQADMPGLMRAVDMFLLPSRYEPFGLVVLEAMASGLPVLTTRQSGIAPLIAPACGLVLEQPDDVATMGRWMAEMAAQPRLRRQTGLAARALAEHHGWPAMAQRYLSLLEDAPPQAAEMRGQRETIDG